MKPQLKRVHSPDVDDVETFAPPVPDHFGVVIQLMIGPEGQVGEESFDVVVCTTRWLEERVRESGLIDLRHHLLVERYDWSGIVGDVEAFLADVEEGSWAATAARVGRLGRWEFEDLRSGRLAP